ncbi:MAG: type II secretion system F family protein [Candidatus Pacearchaeota archaeon]
MKISILLPEDFRKRYYKNIKNANIKLNLDGYLIRVTIYGLAISTLFAVLLKLLKLNPIIIFLTSFILFQIVAYYWTSLKSSTQIRKMESAFPNFIQLMSSNLKAGMTIDKAFLFSARPEFEPLDKEILLTGKEIALGKETSKAFMDLSNRIESEKISRVISLILSGMKAGGNMATLLETASESMREREFLEKRAASNVLMYVIFIFIAVGFGAPFLFALSSILVEVLIGMTSQMTAASLTQTNLPFTFSSIDISINFIIYFSIIFLVTTSIISSLMIGLVNKGSEKQGLKYSIPLIIISVSIFLIIRIVLKGFISSSLNLLP